MSRDHAAKDWSSWNRDGADADTRHYQPSNPDELKYHFENRRILNALEVLQKEAPELAAKIWAGDSDATEALKKFTEKKRAELKKAAAESAKRPTPKRRGFDDNRETTKAAAAILRGLK